MSIIHDYTKPGCIHLPLQRNDWTSTACLGILDNDNNTSPIEKYLHPSELKHFDTYHYEARKKSFLSGRYLAKSVLSHFLHEPDLRKIVIRSGIFNQPLLNYPMPNPPGFSISHSASFTSCLVFPREHPMAIDIESYNSEATEAIASQLTEKEKTLYRSMGLREDIFMLELWTIKEALSKVLTTGLTAPMHIYEIGEVYKKGQFHYSTFKNFAQYKAISFNWKRNICSFVLPLKTKCDLDNLIAYINL
ncbi:4'-phosphopantetheinyl transferase superfamily protein [Fulvivirgaceae bacterium BMA12]|uniref:4'-phosphopantetheinyl transferase superfamily protein n=1 Tax=Agaribacillus aureus TaxID=3051825 RepID=A0ABT8LCF4_9BACT|nr:4'-phosphopantetheinyl transferase superfamily protein [Fulvivirgaceae bacterium BMA12]